jgi:hypothetical protein
MFEDIIKDRTKEELERIDRLIAIIDLWEEEGNIEGLAEACRLAVEDSYDYGEKIRKLEKQLKEK